MVVGVKQVALSKTHIHRWEGVAVVIVDEVLHLAEQLSRLLLQRVFLALHTDTLVMVLLHTHIHTNKVHNMCFIPTYIQTRCTTCASYPHTYKQGAQHALHTHIHTNKVHNMRFIPTYIQTRCTTCASYPHTYKQGAQHALHTHIHTNKVHNMSRRI